ncbi:MAG TPA: hypothetical protein VHM90_19190 [Phycisphaerae bacterium]|nr:hypothetical protein [Phycisphaerae bacterium]
MFAERFRQGAWVALLAAMGGCTAERAHTVPFDGRDNKGVVYSVPKTYLQVTLQYTYTRDDLRPGPPQGHLGGALKILPLLVPDSKSTFLIKTDSLVNNVLFLSNVSFKFNNGTLEAVDATSIDRTGQILEELGTTAVNIAKAAAKGESTPHEKAIIATEQRIDAIYSEIARVAGEAGDAQQKAKALDALQQELNSARKLILDLRANVDPPVRTFAAPVTVMVDPDLPTRATAEYLEYEIRPPQVFADVPAENMDVVCLRIYDDQRRKFTEALHAGHRPGDTGGVLYRQPVALLTKVVTGDPEEEMTEIFSGLVPYAQFSPPAVAALESKMLTSKHTSVVFDTVNGGLVSYGITQDSPVENAAKAAAGLSENAVQIEHPQVQGTGKVTGSTGGRGGSGGGSSGGGSTSGGGRTSSTQSSNSAATSSSTPSRPSPQPSSQPSSQPSTRSGGRGGSGGSQ